MQQPFFPQRTIVVLVAAGLLLPIVLCVLVGVAYLLAGMGDHWGGAVLLRLALAGGILWVLDLICLVLALAVAGMLQGPHEPDSQ